VKSVSDGLDEYDDIICDLKAPASTRRYFLKKTLFRHEASWRASLPEGGEVTVTEPPIPATLLRQMCNTRLTQTTDALRLKELQERFNGGVFVLSTATSHIDIEYRYENISEVYSSFNDRIMMSKTNHTYSSFNQMGADGRPRVMVVYKGLYIDLSHLF
jgi:hypothetical protein